MFSAFDDSPLLITGATSHTGRRLARRLLDRGARLRCMVHTPANRALLPDTPNLELVLGSADRPDDLAKALAGVRTVVQVAHIRFAPAMVAVLGERAKPARLIAISSTRGLSRYPTPIGEVVRDGEAAVRGAPGNVRWTILRPAMIFGGPDDNNVERMARLLGRTRFFPLFGGGLCFRQPLFVWDLVGAIEACLERADAGAGKTYTLAGPEPMTYRAMVEAVARASGAKRPIFLRLPLAPSLLAARALRGVWPGSPLDPELVRRFGEDQRFDISEARRDLGFAPIPFEEALARKFARTV